jgi:hypothetical protein
MAFSYNFDIGCEFGGGFMSNPGRYVALTPPH